MKQGLLCTALIFLLTGHVDGQKQGLLRASHIPGDTIYYATDLLPEKLRINQHGLNSSWDFTNLLSPFVRQRVVEPVISDNLPSSLRDAAYRIKDEEGLYRYYSQKEKGSACLGREIQLGTGKKLLAWYEPPVSVSEEVNFGAREQYEGRLISELKPVSFFQQNILESHVKSDSARLIYDVSIESQYDAAGTLRLMTGNYTVLREKRDMQLKPRLQVARVGQWKDFHPERHIPAWLEVQNAREFIYWSSQEAEPLVTVALDFFNNPMKVHYQTTRWSGHILEKSPDQKDIFAYPNPSFGPIRFDLYNLPDGTYFIEIYNILGTKLKSEAIQMKGQSTVLMDLSDLKKGTYIYRLIDSAKNTIRSKRLVIITP